MHLALRITWLLTRFCQQHNIARPHPLPADFVLVELEDMWIHRLVSLVEDQLTCAIAPARAPDSMRCPGVISSTSSHTMRLMRSLQDSLMAVSGAILITLVPLPRKKALIVPAQPRAAALRPCPCLQSYIRARPPAALTKAASRAPWKPQQAGSDLHNSTLRRSMKAAVYEGAPSAAMRPQPSRTVRPRAVLSTCSSSFMRSTGAVAVRLTAPATPAEHASTAYEKLGWLSSWW